MTVNDRLLTVAIALGVWLLALTIIAASVGVVWLIHHLIGGTL